MSSKATHSTWMVVQLPFLNGQLLSRAQTHVVLHHHPLSSDSQSVLVVGFFIFYFDILFDMSICIDCHKFVFMDILSLECRTQFLVIQKSFDALWTLNIILVRTSLVLRVDPHFSRAPPLDRRDSLFICEKLILEKLESPPILFLF